MNNYNRLQRIVLSSHSLSSLNYFITVFLLIVSICSTESAQAAFTKNPTVGSKITPNNLDTLSPKQIKKIAIRYLKKQRRQNKRTIRQQRKQVQQLSAELEAAIADAIAKNIFSNRALIVGSDERAIGEGMSKRVEITQEPAPDYPYYNVPRAHKDLYDADVLLQQTIARQAVTNRYQENVDALVSTIHQRENNIATSFNKDWIQRRVDSLIQSLL